MLKPLPVQNGQTEVLGDQAFVTVRVEEGGEAREDGTGRNLEGLLMRADEAVRTEYTMEDCLTAPVARGTPVGKVEYILGDTVYRRDIIVTEDELGAVDPQWCLLQILGRFLL